MLRQLAFRSMLALAFAGLSHFPISLSANAPAIVGLAASSGQEKKRGSAKSGTGNRAMQRKAKKRKQQLRAKKMMKGAKNRR